MDGQCTDVRPGCKEVLCPDLTAETPRQGDYYMTLMD